MITSAPFIVLEKSPGRGEASLLLRGISPDYGKVTFVHHGGQSVSRGAAGADIFREVEVEFEDDGSGRDVFSAKKMETLLDFSAVADQPRNYRMAGRIGAFLLANMRGGDLQLHTYDALRAVLMNLAGMEVGHDRWSLVQCSVVIKSAFLYENGMLPEAVSPAQNEFLENLVASGVDNSPLPECPENYWEKMNDWLNALIVFHQLKK